MFGEDVEGEREIGAAERLSGNGISGLRKRQVGLEFFRWFEGPQGKPGDMQRAECVRERDVWICGPIFGQIHGMSRSFPGAAALRGSAGI